MAGVTCSHPFLPGSVLSGTLGSLDPQFQELVLVLEGMKGMNFMSEVAILAKLDIKQYDFPYMEFNVFEIKNEKALLMQ
ncbi:hypothetical protein BTVI_08618 [Pitangus sulphuratus]|nr:hypothetical protein BTVI_08618 [Pitangus sulphuratus]